MAEMTMFERTSTNVVARPMLMPLMAAVVVASTGHMPRIRTNVGFSLIRPLEKICQFVISFVFYCTSVAPDTASEAGPFL